MASRTALSLFAACMLLASATVAACSSSDEVAAGDSSDAGTGSETSTPSGLDAGDAGGGVDLPPVTEACKTDFDEERGLWKHLACSGLYEDIASGKISAAARPYTPGLVFWSDGAAKERWLYLPPGKQIDTTNADKWRFPNETRAWKAFSVGGKLVETRIFYKHENVWAYGSYVWTSDGKDAVLNDDGVPSLDGADGGYEIPPKSQCLDCHFRTDSDDLLGVEAVSLGLPDAKGVTLAALAQGGSLSVVPTKTSITIPDDGRGGALALGWLHANCGTACHSHPGGASFTGLFLRLKASELFAESPPAITALEAYTTSVDVPATHPVDVTKRLDFATASTDEAREANSAIFVLAGTRTFPAGTQQMPPLVSHKVDEAGLALLKAWIDNAQ